MEEAKEKSDYELGMECAWRAFGENDFNDAMLKVLPLIDKYPEKVSNFFLIAHIYLAKKQLNLSVENFEIALKNDKKGEYSGHIYYWLGTIYNMGGPFSDFDGSLYDKTKSQKYFNKSHKSGNYPFELLFELRKNSNGKDLLEMWEEGTSKFPNRPEFYVLLADECKKNGLFNKQETTLLSALELNLNSATIFYNVALFRYSRNEFESSIHYLNKVLEFENAKSYNFFIWYLIGKSNLSLNKLDQAEIFFQLAYNNCEDHNYKLYGLIGLLEVYIQSNNTELITETITNIEINNKLLIDYGLSYGGHLHLDGYYPDSISILNLNEFYKSINTLSLNKENPFFNSKLNIIKAFLANNIGKYFEAHKAILNVWKHQTGINYEVKLSLHYEIISNIIQNKSDTLPSIKKSLGLILIDFRNYSELRTKLVDHITCFIESLYKHKMYQGIVDFSNFYSQTILEEENVIFEVAYSYAEILNNEMAKEYYELYLKNNPTSTAALNNLANIYKREGNFKKALALYEQGFKIDPNDQIIIGNLEKTRNINHEEELKSAKRKIQFEQYNKSLQSLKYENDYILEKLQKFIEKVKLENTFVNWKLPIAKYKFHLLPGVDQQKGEQLREQWLDKGYIVDTGERDERRVIIYEINPLLEDAIKNKTKENKVPQKWINGFYNINIASLETIGYFQILERVSKINKKFQPLIERDFNELVHNYLMGHEKATIVLSGSLVELLLIHYCEKKKMMTLTITDSKGSQKNKKLYDCVLIDLIEFVEQTKPFGNDFYHLSNLSRIYRNFIHPGRELKDSLDKSKAEICFVSTREILNRII